MIRPVKSASDVETVRVLFLEYAASLEISLCFQGFDKELAGLPGAYSPPQGRLLLAEEEEGVAGCAGLRPLDAGVCEMKRLFVRPEFRGRGIARGLVAAVLAGAREEGYSIVRLDTLPQMKEARALYGTLGFRPIEPYYENPHEGVLFLERDLRLPD